MKKGSNFSEVIGNKLAVAVEQNNIVRAREIITNYSVGSLGSDPVLNINKPIVKLFNNEMNALGYSLFLGHTEIFIMLLELGRAKLSVMTKMFIEIGKRPVDVMCELGHKNLLEYYLPFYLSQSDEIEEAEELSISLSFSKSKNTKSHEDKSKPITLNRKMAPIHRACEKERLGVIQYLFEYFRDKTAPPEFDVHLLDEATGENCALISCKTGNLEVMQYLFEVCQADFHIYNKRKENAIQIMSVWSKKKKDVKFLECFKYLIEVVGVDYNYEFEETLLILNDQAIIDYLQEKLKNDGVSFDKSKLDAKYSLSKHRVPVEMDPELKTRLEQVKGPNFNFRKLFSNELHDSEEEMSSINQNENPQSIQSTSLISFIKM